MSFNQQPIRDKDGMFKIKTEAFASKTVEVNGVKKDLYKRIHGESFSVANNQSNTCDFIIPYAHVKIEGIEVLNGNMQDDLSFYVYDADGNPYSGAPWTDENDRYLLNQFAFNVHPKNDFYVHHSQYDADLYSGMIIRILYNNTGSGKDIYMNFILNEVK